VIYLRQEGRGIGLLEKIRAYNLQDMGYDTVAANILLGHQADERRYDIAAAILRDLGLGSDSGVRILTNNPDKVEALKNEGIVVKERLPMVPRSWAVITRATHPSPASILPPLTSDIEGNGRAERERRKPGATMIGGGAVSGAELEKYLRTKVLKMGHLLELPTFNNPQPTHDIILPIAPEMILQPGDGEKVEVGQIPVVSINPSLSESSNLSSS
jgi:GTP cyclohydrolase II